jgi:hypothetical protein
MKRCLAQGRERFELWVAAAVLANNLMKIAARWRTDHCADEKPPDIPSGASFCGGKTSAGHCNRRLVQRTLREIATKIASEYLGECPHPPSVYPSFIEELTRLRTNAGVSRQKLARAFSVPIESERGSISCFDAFSSPEPVIHFAGKRFTARS